MIKRLKLSESLTIAVDPELCAEFLEVLTWNEDFQEHEVQRFDYDYNSRALVTTVEVNITKEQLEKAFKFIDQHYQQEIF